MKKFLLIDQSMATYATVIKVKMIAAAVMTTSSAICPSNFMVSSYELYVV